MSSSGQFNTVYLFPLRLNEANFQCKNFVRSSQRQADLQEKYSRAIQVKEAKMMRKNYLDKSTTAAY